MLKQRHQLFVALLVMVDALVIATACGAAWSVRRMTAEGYWPGNWESWLRGPLFVFAIPIVLYAMWMMGLYRPRRDRSLWTEEAQVLKAVVLAIGAMVVVLWAVGNDVIGKAGPRAAVPGLGIAADAGRVQIGALAVILLGMFAAHRALFRMGLRVLRRRGKNLRHVAIIGVGRLGQVVLRTLEHNSWTGLHVAYFLSAKPTTDRTACLGRPVRGGLDALEAILEREPVDAVYIAIPNAGAAVVPPLIQRLERYAVGVRIVPDVHPRYVPQSMVVGELDGMPVLSVRECPMSGLGGVSKRALDIAGSLAALAIFSPVMLAAALAIRVTSPGPVIFKQRRVSLGGRRFKIYKFRTMAHVPKEHRAAAEGEPRWTEDDDPRITRVGRFLRRTSLDELPQLLNVLKGQMSLVGPRPERPELISKFRESWRGYMLRQHVKAGMTGWAQVNGLRGNTCLRRRLRHDLFYVKHWSLGLDLRILVITLFRGFVHRNAQ